MRNQYAGTCYRCGETVSVGAGHFERHRGGWRVQHASCARAYRHTEVGNAPEDLAHKAREAERRRTHRYGADQ